MDHYSSQSDGSPVAGGATSLEEHKRTSNNCNNNSETLAKLTLLPKPEPNLANPIITNAWISVKDLCDHSETNLGNDSVGSAIIWQAVRYSEIHRQWTVFYCYECDKKFSNAESHLDHMLYQHLPFNYTDNVILLPKNVKNCARAPMWSLDWKEPSLAWFRFMYCDKYDFSLHCFTKGVEIRKGCDKRTRLLKRVGEAMDSLLNHHDVSTGQLTRLIERITDYFIGGLHDDKLIVATDILDRSLQPPIGIFLSDYNCLKLLLKRLRWLKGLFNRQHIRNPMRDCNEEFKASNDNFLHSVSFSGTYAALCFYPTKLSAEPEPESPSIRVQQPWTGTEMHEKFSTIFERTKTLIHGLNTKFEKKQGLLRNWDFVVVLERVLFKEGRSSVQMQSCLEEWREKLISNNSSDDGLKKSFGISFICDVLRISRQSHKPIQVIFRQLKCQKILDQLDYLDVQISDTLARLDKSKKDLSFVCAFDYRMTFLPVLKSFLRANNKPKNFFTFVTEYLSARVSSASPSTRPIKETSFVNYKAKVEVTDKTLEFWSSLSEEKKKELFSVKLESIRDYCRYHLRSPWLENEVLNAEKFFNFHKTWGFFSCNYRCSRPYADEEAYIKHLGSISHLDISYWGWQFRPEPIAETKLAKVLLKMNWAPIDVLCALKAFASLLPECTDDYALMEWPTIKDDRKRIKRLSLLKEHCNTLIRQKPSILSYAHLQTMIDLAWEQVCDQLLIPTKDRFIFTRILRHSPLCFRFLDSKSLGRFVVHFSTIRKITNKYSNSEYHGDSESEDYDSERELHWMRNFKYDTDYETDVFWRNRENTHLVSFSHTGSVNLDVKNGFHENEGSLLSWVLDAPLVPKIPEYPDKLHSILGDAERLRYDDLDNQRMEPQMPALHYYISRLEEYTCFKRWIQLSGSNKYELLIIRRYEYLLGYERLSVEDEFYEFPIQLRKHRGTKCNCVTNDKKTGSSFCYTCCVASLQIKRNFSISKQTRHYMNSWQSIERLNSLEPLASRAADKDYRVMFLPLIRCLIRLKLQVWLSGGGQGEFDKFVNQGACLLRKVSSS